MGRRDQQATRGLRLDADLGGAVALALGALVWGLALAPRTYGDGDASELTLALAVGGVPHPTGYPLYVLAGHLFVRLLNAAGVSWPVAANAWSAAGGAVAAFFLHRLAAALAADRLPQGGRARALLVLLPLSLLLAQPIWSAAATQAEVSSWHAAWVAAAAWFAWSLAASRATAARRALVWGAVVGAGLAHHATSAFVSLPLTAWLAGRLSGAGARPAPLLAPFAAGLAIPLASLGWIAWRALSPAPHQWPLLEPGLGGLLAHVTGRMFGGYLGGFHPTPADAALLRTALPWLAVALPLLGAAAWAGGATPRRSFARALAGASLLQALFLLAYRVPDPSSLALPLLVLGSLWIPRGAAALSARAGAGTVALLLAAAAIGFLPAWVPRALQAKRSAEATDRIVRAAWEAVPFERGLVAWNNDLSPRLEAYQLFERRHTERIVEHPGMLTWERPRRAFRERLGFDPWGGSLPERDDQLSERLVRSAAAAGLRSIDFDDAIRAALRSGEAPPTPR